MDDFGRVFFYQGKVFRKISPDKSSFCIELLNSNLFEKLKQKKYLPKTLITNQFEGEGLILEHHKILQTLQHEWSFSMFKEAAMMVLEVNEISNKHGYELKDAHTMNVLFQGINPVFVDIGSIDFKLNPSDKSWIAYDEFLNSFFIPLLFWSSGNHYVVRKLLESNFYKIQTTPNQTIYASGLLNLLNVPTSFYEFKIRSRILFNTKKRIKGIDIIVRFFRKIRKTIWLPSILKFSYEKKNIQFSSLYPLNTIKKTIKELDLPFLQTPWSGYHEINYGLPESLEGMEYKRFWDIIKLIKGEKEIKTVIDLAGNEGYFSIMLSREVALQRIIMADNDENAVDCAFLNIKRLGFKNITPILLNFMFTSDVEGTSQRLKSDLVVALAVTHHLILTDKYTLPAIFERLCSLSNAYVIVEFMPLGLWSPNSTINPTVPEWYSVEWFRAEYFNYFNLIIEKKLEKNRILFYGKKKMKV